MKKPGITTEKKRRLLIDLALKHNKKGSGSSKEFLTKRTTQKKWIDLTHILKPIRWAVVGAVATRLYMPERTTSDLDVVISLEDACEAREKMKEAGFRFQHELSIGGASWLSSGRKAVDLIESDTPWIDDALEESQHNRDKQGLPILLFHYLVLMKFQSGRLVDMGDISRMLGQADPQTILTTKKLFRVYDPQSLEDLEDLIMLGKSEIQ